MKPANRILIVDDDHELLSAIVRNLGERFDIVTADSGESGLLKIAADGPFSVVLSDVRMPGMGGVKFLQQVREITPDTVRMVLTGHADQRAAVDAINDANVFRFLDKPTPVKVLKEAIEGAIDHYRLIATEKQLAEALALNETIVAEAPVGIYLYRADGQCVLANPAAARLSGETQQSLLAQNFRTEPSWRGSGLREVCLSALADNQAKEFELCTVSTPGTEIWAHLRLCPLSLDGIRHLLIVGDDLSEKKQRENAITRLTEELGEINERFSFANQSAGIGVWDYLIPEDQLIWDRGMLALYGLEEKDFHGAYRAWQNAVHPEDKARGDAEINAALRGEKKFDTEFRVVWPNGDIRHIKAAAIVHRDAGGRPLRMIGVNYDITEVRERKIQLEAALAQARTVSQKLVKSEQFVRFIADSVPEMIGYVDTNQKYVFVNNAYEKFTGKSKSEIIGHTPQEILGETTFSTIRSHIDAVLAGQAQCFEHTLSSSRGDTFTFQINYLPDFSADNRVAGYFISVYDITAHRELEEHLATAKRDAEIATTAKTSFLANMSHEMRSPMNAIIGLSSLLMKRVEKPENIEMLKSITISGQHLLSLINDILDLSKIQTGKFELHVDDFLFSNVVDAIKRQVSLVTEEKKLAFSVEIDPALPNQMVGDELRLRQCLLNYLSNAIKFTHQGGVKLRAKLIEDRQKTVLCRFEVEDTGIGIREDKKDYLFKDFQQADGSTSREYGGTGLGLAITRRLADMMGGAAGFSSVEGRGSVFWFEAVLGKAGDGTQLQPGDGGRSSEQIEQELGGRHRQAQILLVEDNEINRNVILGMLQDVGLSAAIAGNGLLAVEAVKATAFDLILMDMQMPMMDGLEATRAIRRLAAGQRVPIVALTANAYAEDRKKCLDAGMNDHLAKPVLPEALYALLLKWLDSLGAPGRATTAQTATPTAAAASAENPEARLRHYLGDIVWIDLELGIKLSRRLDRYIRVLGDYANEYGDAMGRLRRHLLAGETAEARRIAHTLKGSSSMLGVTGVEKPAAQLEQAILAGAPADHLIADVETRYAAIAGAVRSMMNDHRDA